MGGLISGILGLVDGDPTKTEENELASLSAYETPQGQQATTAANNFYGGILSGNPEQIATTLAPEISAATGQAEQKKKTNAEFGNRGGGTNAANQAIDAGTRGDIINLIGQEQNTAAAGEAGLGTNLLSQSSGNINAQAGLAEQAEKNKLADVGDIAQGAAQIASGFFDPAAMGSSATPQSLFDLGNSGGPVATEEQPFNDFIQ